MEDLVSRIQRYIEDELFDDAITLCIEANARSPDSKWNLWIARALYQQREYRRCVVCLEQCPRHESSLLLAKCFFHLGEFNKALSFLQDVSDEVLMDAPYFKLMGDVLSELGYTDLAKTAYLTSYQKDPLLLSVRHSLHELGVYVEEKENESECSSSLQSVHLLGVQHAALVQHQPIPYSSSPLHYYYRFISAYDENNYSKACQSFTTLQHIFPWWNEGVDRYSSILFVEKREKELAALWTQVSQNAPQAKETAVVHANLASLRGEGNVLGILDQLTNSFPRYSYGYQLLGDEQILCGEPDKALTAFRTALRLSPFEFRVWLGLGDCYALKGDSSTAQCHYEEALRLYPGCVSGLCRLIQSFVQQGEISKAQRHVDQGLKVAPEDVKLLLLQAQIFRLQKQWKRAVEVYEKVLAKSSLEVSVYMDMAQCYHELGNMAESKRLLFLAAKMDSQNQHAIMGMLKDYQFEE